MSGIARRLGQAGAGSIHLVGAPGLPSPVPASTPGVATSAVPVFAKAQGQLFIASDELDRPRQVKIAEVEEVELRLDEPHLWPGVGGLFFQAGQGGRR